MNQRSHKDRNGAHGALIVKGKKGRTALPSILRSAVDLFATKGVDRTTVRDVAAAAGVSEGALYRHFRGKQELTDYLRDTHLDWAAEQISSLAGQHQKYGSQVEAAVGFFCRFAEEDPSLFAFLFLGPEATPAIEIALGAIVQQGVEQGRVDRSRAPLAPGIVLGIVTQTVRSRRQGRLRTDLTGWAPTLTQVCLDATRGRPRPR